MERSSEIKYADAALENISKEKQIKNTLLYLTPAIISNALPILSLPIILRNLSSEKYGAYVLSIAYSLLIISICHFALSGVYDRNFFVYKDERGSSQLIYSIIIFVVSTTLLAGFITYTYKVQLAQWITQSGKNGNLIFFTFCAQAVFNLKNYFLIFLKNTAMAKAHVLYTISESIIVVCLSLYFVAVLQLGPLGLALGTLIGSSFVFLILTINFLKRVPFSLNFTILMSSLKLSLPLMSTHITGVAGKQFDKYIIGALSSVGGTGVYAIGQRISNLIFIFMTALQNVFNPMVYHKMFTLGSKGGKDIGKYLTPFAYASAAIGLFISLASEELLKLLAPATYQNADAIVNVLCISFVISFFAKQPQLMYAGKTIVQALLTAVNFVCTVVILYIFVNNYGIIGAAVGIVIVQFIYISLLLWKGQQYYRINYEVSKLVMIFGSFILMSISVFVFREWGMAYIVRLIIKIFYVVIFVGLGIHLRILGRDNLRFIINSIVKKS